MNVDLIRLLCAILALIGTIFYMTGSSFCLVHPKLGLTYRGYFYSVATACGLVANCTLFILLVRAHQKYLERFILICSGIFAFSGAVDTIEKNFLSEVVQMLLMMGGLLIVLAYTVLLLRGKVIMKRIVQLSSFFTMVGGGLIAISAMLLTKSKQYFTLAQTLHLVSTCCYFTGATLNLVNQTRVFHGYPEFGTKQYLKMVFLKKLPQSRTRNSVAIQLIDMKAQTNQQSTTQGDSTPSDIVQDIKIRQPSLLPEIIERKKANTQMPNITIRDTMYNPNPSQRYSTIKAPLNQRLSFNPVDEGFYA